MVGAGKLFIPFPVRVVSDCIEHSAVVFTCGEASRSMDDDSSSRCIWLTVALRAQESMATWVIEATEFDSEVVCDLRGR